MHDSVVRDWVATIPYKMQAVLLSALRGCDGIPKEDVSKTITRAIRSVFLYPAVKNYNEPGMFMAVNKDELYKCVDKFSQHLDHYPNHFITHLMHAMEIVGYKHPEPSVAGFWHSAYYKCCEGMHVGPESLEQLNRRLAGDYGPISVPEELGYK